MDVSIILVNYKTKDLTINAIKSIIEKTVEIKYEIFVVDNASQDGSIEAIEKQFPDITIIKSEKNGGFGYANNLAIKKAQGKYILCLNTDTLLINNAIKIMFDYMEQYQNVGVCGGQLFNPDGSYQLSYDFFPNFYTLYIRLGLFRFFLKPKAQVKKITNVDFIIGADIFFRKSSLDEFGLFDENIFMYGEESELCYRIQQKYQIVVVPDAKIIHIGGESSDSDFSFMSKMFGLFYFIKKHKIMLISLAKLYFIIKYLIAFIICRKTIYLNAISNVISIRPQENNSYIQAKKEEKVH